MTRKLSFLAVVLLAVCGPVVGHSSATDPVRDILVTYRNDGARAIGGSFAAPYRYRKRYSISASARRSANEISDEYALLEIDHWPIRSLAVYCFVYRIANGDDRDTLISRLKSDPRIESVQALQTFDTELGANTDYDDTYARLQHGLEMMSVEAAHRRSRGKGVRIAIIDSHADAKHEDLRGRVRHVGDFSTTGSTRDAEHGTAVASVIGAKSNNAKGIVGVAPESNIELFVSCWAEPGKLSAICDSFSLAKALDTLLQDPPDILNLSLAGPHDPLLERLLKRAHRKNVIVVAARVAEQRSSNSFPANLDTVIAVGSSSRYPALSQSNVVDSGQNRQVFAPGNQIMVAMPGNAYDFRSGSSLASAHASGVVALLLSVSPELSFNNVWTVLNKSQNGTSTDVVSINACAALKLADEQTDC